MTATRNTAFAQVRRAAGISQEELAREADCSVAWVRVLEAGATPDPDRSPVYERVIEVLRKRTGDAS